MNAYFLITFYALLLSLVASGISATLNNSSGEAKCIERERKALLSFKQGITHDFDMLSTWTNHHNNTDSCKWKHIQCNHQTGRIPSTFGNLLQLRCLNLGDNYLWGEIPIQIGNLKHLQYLDQKSIDKDETESREMPKEITYMFGLVSLNLSRNNLNGEIPSEIGNLSLLDSLDLSRNNFSGKIPSTLCKPLMPQEKFHYFCYKLELLLSANKFSDFVCVNVTTTSLATLDLSDNQIKGQLPDCWKSVNGLLFLDLSINQLSGKIPISMGTLVKLEALVLRNNNLTGELPFSLKNCNNLIMLDVSENMLSGSIPSWVGENMQQLIILIMRGNQFSGDIPLHLCYLKRIQLLDLSRNKMSHGIPTCLNNFTAFSQKSTDKAETESRVHWYNTTYYEIYNFFGASYYTFHITWMWKGMERSFTRPELILQSIDLSSNNLTGEMPKEITYMLGLVSLNLSRNNLNGEIPSEIGNLSLLDSLDLSRNNFSGKIPSTLSNIDRLAMLDLSKNHLSGRIPWGRQLQTFDASSFEGNLDLCGKPLEKICPGDETMIKSEGPEEHDEDDNSIFYGAFYMSLGLGFFIGFWGLLGPLLFWQSWRVAYLMLLNRLIDYILVVTEFTAFEKCNPLIHLTYIQHLDLSHNYLVLSYIPEFMGSFSNLRYLDLSNSYFSGRIPSTFGNLLQLRCLNLGDNYLWGEIPIQIGNLKHLQYLDQKSIDKDETESRVHCFEGNLDLCGKPLEKICPGDETMIKSEGPEEHDEDDNSIFYGAFYMSLGLGFFIGFWGLLGPLLFWQSWRVAYLMLLNRLIDYILVVTEVKIAKFQRWLKD
ncbi:receptor-like protein EIX1 [Vigna umbellata]|uniref:receptor-like protein EIX1 n=1 Tax=Vigna umbellata TaxID=87088 RepID=UPI001F5F883C|nr:receptor-like protein EIX1 [Vigna umbellata]